MFEFKSDELTMAARHQVVLRRNEVLAHELVTAERHIATLLRQAEVLLERVNTLAQQTKYFQEKAAAAVKRERKARRKVSQWRTVNETVTGIFQEGMQTLEQEVAWLRHENDDLLRQLESVRGVLTEWDIVLGMESADGKTPPPGSPWSIFDSAETTFRLYSIPHGDPMEEVG